MDLVEVKVNGNKRNISKLEKTLEILGGNIPRYRKVKIKFNYD
jgi:hypothetical protein